MSNLSHCRTVIPAFKRFVRGSDIVSNLNETNNQNENKVFKKNKLSGADAKRTYEYVVGSSALGSSAPASASIEPSSSSYQQLSSTPQSKEAISVNMVMKFAEQDDVKSLSKAIQIHQNLLNCTDSFGWTPLMCASCAGSSNAVAYLLSAGADSSVRDKRGDSCKTLARKRGCLQVLSMLLKHGRTQKKGSELFKSQVSNGYFYCQVCKCTVAESCRQKHLTSTVHLLCKHRHSVPTLYGIPENNRGYQILLRHGWDREHGLGPKGEGKKLPPKTVLKTDRKGIGAMKLKPRVTHFGANDVAAVSSERVQAHYKRKNKKRHFVEETLHDKLWEQNLRRELS